MRVLIAKSLKKEYLSKISHLDTEKLIKNIKNISHKFINLKHPFLKFKIKISGVAYRGIVAIVNEDICILLILVQKKDKKQGENINWKKDNILIKNRFDTTNHDIENGEYEIF